MDLTYVLCFRWLKVNCGDPVDGCVVYVPLLLSENVTGQNIDKIRKNKEFDKKKSDRFVYHYIQTM